MAGVPPFWGFFSKLFIFTLVCTSYFFSLYPFLFLIIFIGLYFYIQNIRFLNATAGANFQPIIELNLRAVPTYYYISLTISFLLIFGFSFTEDLLLVVSWTLF
jgi:NADH:ubiquinone oxidoreductase subunit 2 (subunit N)